MAGLGVVDLLRTARRCVDVRRFAWLRAGFGTILGPGCAGTWEKVGCTGGKLSFGEVSKGRRGESRESGAGIARVGKFSLTVWAICLIAGLGGSTFVRLRQRLRRTTADRSE